MRHDYTRPTSALMKRAAFALGLLAASLALFLWAARIHQSIAITKIAPGVIGTSGCEEDSWYAISNEASGAGAYHDPLRVPFAASYFNILYYKFYAALAKPYIARFGVPAVIVAGRMTSALGALVGCVSLFWFLWRGRGASWVDALALAVFVFAGPLVGWWSVTVRPDVWALCFETLGMLAFLRWCESPRPTFLLLATILLYLAWAFKPTFFLALVAVVGTLLLTGRWRGALSVGIGSVILWSATLALGGEAYRHMVLHTATVNRFVLSIGLGNFKEAFTKILPAILCIASLVLGRRLPAALRSIRSRPAELFLVLGTVVAGGFACLGASKAGSSSNYYFSFSSFATLLMWSLLERSDGRRRTFSFGIFSLGFLLVQIPAMINMEGPNGLLARASQDSEVWERWSHEKEPRFSAQLPLNVPWLNPNSPPLILAYNYSLDRQSNRAFERDGVRGMIQRGELESIMLPAELDGHFDGVPLKGYSPAYRVNDFVVYRKIP